MRGKCKFHMALNCLKTDYFEKKNLGGIEICMYFKKYFWTISIKILLLGGFICHAMSLQPLSIQSISIQKICKKIYQY